MIRNFHVEFLSQVCGATLYHQLGEFMKRIRYVIESLLQDRLAYFDLHLDNIGISKGEIIFSDLDGVEDNPTRRFIDGTYYNMYLCYLSILLD